jgi:hypothetical protein
MPQADHSGYNPTGDDSHAVARRHRKHFHVSRIRYSPITSDDLSRRFVALFDMLGLSEDLFDNRPQGNRIKQRP